MAYRFCLTLCVFMLTMGSAFSQIQKQEKKEIIIKAEADGSGKKIVIVNGDTVNIDQFGDMPAERKGATRDLKGKGKIITIESDSVFTSEFRTMPFLGQRRPGMNPGVMERLMQRPKLGVEVQEQENEKGLKVITVMGGSAAENAGLKNKDVILMADDKEVDSVDELRNMLAQKSDKVTLTVLREGKKMKMEVKFPKPLKKGIL